MGGASECIKSYSEALSSKAEFWKMIRCLRFFIFAYFFSEFLSKSDEDIRSSIKVLNICQNGIFCIQQASYDIDMINYEWYIKG